MNQWNREMIDALIKSAMDARAFAYAPYSHFTVGAALLAKIEKADEDIDSNLQDEQGNFYKIIQGCNIENASYPAGNCAERTALYKAVSQGYHQFGAIAIVAGAKGEEAQNYTSPCGICRQVLREFVNTESFFVILARSKDDYKIMTLEELLPMSFGPENLQ